MGELFECAPDEIPEDADPDTLEGWDSLRQIELMVALEGEFGVRIPMEAMLELVTLAQIDDYMCAHAGDRA
jgi:acyl carrier protein